MQVLNHATHVNGCDTPLFMSDMSRDFRLLSFAYRIYPFLTFVFAAHVAGVGVWLAGRCRAAPPVQCCSEPGRLMLVTSGITMARSLHNGRRRRCGPLRSPRQGYLLATAAGAALPLRYGMRATGGSQPDARQARPRPRHCSSFWTIQERSAGRTVATWHGPGEFSARLNAGVYSDVT